jgi:hypothetical protein
MKLSTSANFNSAVILLLYSEGTPILGLVNFADHYCMKNKYYPVFLFYFFCILKANFSLPTANAYIP